MDDYEVALAAVQEGHPHLIRFFSQRNGRELLVAVDVGNE
jgi:hypothetical protein